MKKSLISSIILIFTSLCLSGQQPLDTIILKNGSIVYGKLKGSSANTFSIQTTEGYQFSFSSDEVERYISADKYIPEKSRPEGIGFSIQSGLLIGSDKEAFFALFSITPMITYTIDKIHSLSAGTGLELYEELMLPLFAEYKVNFSTKRSTPFFYTKAGALFYLQPDEEYSYYSTDHKTGCTFGTGLGLLWPLGTKESYVQIGYRYSFTKYLSKHDYGILLRENTQNFNRFDFSLGFKF